MDQAITQLAEKVGIAADRLWPQMVAVTYYTSLAWLVMEIVMVLVAVVVVPRLAPKVRAAFRNDDDFPMQLGGSLLLIALVACAVVALVSIPNSLAGVLAPEAVTATNLARSLR